MSKKDYGWGTIKGKITPKKEANVEPESITKTKVEPEPELNTKIYQLKDIRRIDTKCSR